MEDVLNFRTFLSLSKLSPNVRLIRKVSKDLMICGTDLQKLQRIRRIMVEGNPSELHQSNLNGEVRSWTEEKTEKNCKWFRENDEESLSNLWPIAFSKLSGKQQTLLLNWLLGLKVFLSCWVKKKSQKEHLNCSPANRGTGGGISLRMTHK